MDKAAVIFDDLNKNEEFLKNEIGKSSDINYRRFTIPALDNCNALIVNLNGMCDKKEADAYIVAPLLRRFQLNNEFAGLPKAKRAAMLLKSGLFISAGKESNTWSEICDAIVSGNTALFVDGSGSALILYTRSYEHRSVTEPSTEAEVRGPRDGFVENLQVNISLIRIRIKDFGLRFEDLQVGKRTKTSLCLAYINTLVNDSILEELRTRIGRIDTDRILESANLEELIEDSPNSVFPVTEHTERPDKASSAILNGRIVILLDNTPFVLIVPTVFWNFLHPIGDIYKRRYPATFLRFIRVAALFLSLSLSSLYVLLSSFHHEMLPTSFALKIAEGRIGVPFPAPIEAFAMEFALEVMKEAGLLLPQPIGQIVSIVGTFVIGQAAVSAGVVGPVLVIFMALSAICSFAVPVYELGVSIRLLSYLLLIASSFLGIFGYLGGLMVIFSYLLSLRSFGEPFLAPMFPYYKGEMKKIFIRQPFWKVKLRPKMADSKDPQMQSPKDMKPRPPSNEADSNW